MKNTLEGIKSRLVDEKKKLVCEVKDTEVEITQ